MAEIDKKGHRDRLKERFVNEDQTALTDEALLELLLTYAIPLKDVQPLAKDLIAKFGSLEGVLSADLKALFELEGIKTHTAILIKLTNWIRNRYHSDIPAPSLEVLTRVREQQSRPEKAQEMLFHPPIIEVQRPSPIRYPRPKPEKYVTPRSRPGSGLFGKAVLEEAIEILPQIPDADSLEEVKVFLRRNLHFNAEETRRRYTDYIVHRMFNDGNVDQSLLSLSRRYKNRQELREVCFYRFCKAQPIMYDVIEHFLVPSIGNGRLSRENLRSYLKTQYPAWKSLIDSAKAVVDALTAGGIVTSSRIDFSFHYREPLLPSFAFILHSEFPEPGMYDVSKLETNTPVRSMLWNPDRIIPALYELRNTGIIAKISEIDNIRQFTTKWTLPQVVDNLINNGKA